VVPGSWLSVLLFVILVAPGLLFDLLSDRRRGGFPESTFREISRVVLASFGFSAAAFGVLVLIGTYEPNWMPDPRRMIGSADTYLPDHYRLIFRALVIQAGLGLLFAVLVHLWLAHKQGATIRRASAWTQIFKTDCPDGGAPYVRVRLKSGFVYTGFVGYFSPDLDQDGRELVLLPPLYAKPPEGGKLTVMPVEHTRLIFRGSEIDMMTVQYRPDPTVGHAEASTGTRRRWRRQPEVTRTAPSSQDGQP
jgi:Family of unknown function (DUF6338)